MYSYRQFPRSSQGAPETKDHDHTLTQKNETLAFLVSLAAKVGETNNYTLSWGSHIILF